MKRLNLLLIVSIMFNLSCAISSTDFKTEAVIEKNYPIPHYQPRFNRLRPLIAVLGENSGTELIDFVVPYGILSQSGVANVLSVAASPGLIQMRPVLKVNPQSTMEKFDIKFPEGADYVIVPAFTDKKIKDPAILSWIKSQSLKGSTIVSICDGALVVANAGVFKGHYATGHWSTQKLREKEFLDTKWIKNIRYVGDGKVISSAGVTAAVPVSLALVEAIAGTAKASALAKDLGILGWGSKHNSEQFKMGLNTYLTYAKNTWFKSHQLIGIPVATGIDEIALALSADAFSRTQRSKVFIQAQSLASLQTKNGLTILPDHIQGSGVPMDLTLDPFEGTPSALALDKVLGEIENMYGHSTAKFVAAQIEYQLVAQPQ